MKEIIKLCFFGPSGSGKTTCHMTLVKLLNDTGMMTHYDVEPLNVADDIKSIHDFANNTMYGCFNEKSTDGELMGFLAEHYSHLLGKRYIKQVKTLEKQSNVSVIIVNTDCRNNAYNYLKKNGFIFIRVKANDETRKERLKKRKDFKSFDLKKKIEDISEIVPDYHIDNNGDKTQLYLNMAKLVKEIWNGRKNTISN